MLLDLDSILNQVKPKPLTLKLDGREYSVKRLRIADAVQLDGIDKLGDEKFREFMMSLFTGEIPECVRRIGSADLDEDARIENTMAVLVVKEAIARTYVEQESAQKKVAAAMAMLSAQVAAARAKASDDEAPSTSGTASS